MANFEKLLSASRSRRLCCQFGHTVRNTTVEKCNEKTQLTVTEISFYDMK